MHFVEMSLESLTVEQLFEVVSTDIQLNSCNSDITAGFPAAEQQREEKDEEGQEQQRQAKILPGMFAEGGGGVCPEGGVPDLFRIRLHSAQLLLKARKKLRGGKRLMEFQDLFRSAPLPVQLMLTHAGHLEKPKAESSCNIT
mmetsp:Transcript_3354/g.4903  ORF Transcript_3354/g.4903 Transcript_3354/m.4903 type:complete len:142 (-) Transcript_3354:15-440(-)